MVLVILRGLLFLTLLTPEVVDHGLDGDHAQDRTTTQKQPMRMLHSTVEIMISFIVFYLH